MVWHRGVKESFVFKEYVMQGKEEEEKLGAFQKFDHL